MDNYREVRRFSDEIYPCIIELTFKPNQLPYIVKDVATIIPGDKVRLDFRYDDGKHKRARLFVTANKFRLLTMPGDFSFLMDRFFLDGVVNVIEIKPES